MQDEPHDPPLNPFAAPSADIGLQPEQEQTPEEAVRHQYLRREQNIKSIGLLCYLSALLSGFLLVSAIPVQAFFNSSTRFLSSDFVLIVVVLASITGINLALGRGLRLLKRWSRIPMAILSGIGMLSIPIGTIMGAIFLYLLLSPKGKHVFTEEYQAIVDATPHVKLKTSKIVLVLLLLMLVGFLLVLTYALLGN
ncbi:hypothetical protein ACFL2H_01465 [Planctomycetota bacterium]